MIVFLTVWTTLATLAVACAIQFEFPLAVAAWGAVVAALCVCGSFLISQQPPGIATMSGQFGAAVVRWGFRAGHGRLMPAAVISWLVWFVLGASTIASIDHPDNFPILAACTGDLLGLFHVIGVMFATRSRRITASLAKVAAAPIGLIALGTFLWFRIGSDLAQAAAVLVAGGPPLLAGVAYGFALVTNRSASRRNHH